MPSVSSPSDGGYQYYSRALSELEDELQAEVKAARRREEERSQALEERYMRTLADRDREAEEAIRDTKEKANDSLSRERENSKAELERIKASTYDRTGKLGHDLAAGQQDREELQRSMETAIEKSRAQVKQVEESYERRFEEHDRSVRQKAEQAIAKARESRESQSEGYEDEKAAFSSLRQELTRRYEELDRDRKKEAEVERRSLSRALESSAEESKHREDSIIRSAQSKLATVSAASEDRRREDARRINESHERVTGQLRDEIRSLVTAEGAYAKEKGQGTADAVRDYENEWRHREYATGKAFEGEIEKLKRAGKEADAHFNRVNNEALQSKDAYFAKLLNQQNTTRREELKQVSDSFQQDRDEMLRRLDVERSQSRDAMKAQLENLEKSKNTALENQATAYQASMARQKSLDRDEKDVLQRQLDQKVNAKEGREVPAAAEAAIRRTVAAQYDKTFQAEQERNRRAAESFEGEYRERLNATVAEKQRSETERSRSFAMQRNLDRQEFLSHIGETEASKEAAINTRETEHNRQTEAMFRNHADILERQRREYEEILTTLRDDANNRLASFRQQSEFDAKMAQRAFTARQNELIREYDKKLADQKQDYDLRLDEMKTQTQQALRDGERKNKQLLDEQARSYEQRLAQMEFQQKERERNITLNYQEDLEKIKRSNALLKKS